jgi:hypothetical protein
MIVLQPCGVAWMPRCRFGIFEIWPKVLRHSGLWRESWTLTYIDVLNVLLCSRVLCCEMWSCVGCGRGLYGAF